MPQNLTKVDNKGQGNCGYYAYAISFMYYLKQTDGNIHDYKDAIGLDEKNCTDLQKVIDNKKQEEITPDELQTIQSILGPKLREITAERTQLEFIASPADSAVHHALNFKLRQKVKEILAETHPEHAGLIEVATGRQAADYDSAELFKVGGLTAKIEEHAKVLADRFKVVKDPTKVNIDGFFSENTTKFFTENDNENLNEYTAHIATNGIWAQEEQLTTLHRQITGETSSRDRETNEVIISRERKIPLAIYKDGKNASGSMNDHSGIILNNQSNTHWTSLAFTNPRSYQKQVDLEKNTNNTYKELITKVFGAGYDTSQLNDPELLNDIYQQAKLNTKFSGQGANEIFEQSKKYLENPQLFYELDNLYDASSQDFEL